MHTTNCHKSECATYHVRYSTSMTINERITGELQIATFVTKNLNLVYPPFLFSLLSSACTLILSLVYVKQCNLTVNKLVNTEMGFLICICQQRNNSNQQQHMHGKLHMGTL